MNRRKKSLIPAAVVAAALFVAAPASAGQGGKPAPGSCGIGAGGAHAAIADPTSSGATEASQVKPQDVFCTGKPTG